MNAETECECVHEACIDTVRANLFEAIADEARREIQGRRPASIVLRDRNFTGLSFIVAIPRTPKMAENGRDGDPNEPPQWTLDSLPPTRRPSAKC